ncbi:hypothetical protein RKE29_28330 [Streptomyces sp. B1866]|uniref:hypothetical protein n=1 Tax=Streptomyces sp. B1866 TaxID=3075431 RepID=UPI00288F04D5|nr:hypothetical protein [Streptomyces sp. B1866]MDT3400469.1 hypothetical protein [Streptomyces sp. B1866]
MTDTPESAHSTLPGAADPVGLSGLSAGSGDLPARTSPADLTAPAVGQDDSELLIEDLSGTVTALPAPGICICINIAA